MMTENGCKGYHKGCYASMALASGLSYSYFDPEYFDESTDANPINGRKYVHVDAELLALSSLYWYDRVINNLT